MFYLSRQFDGLISLVVIAGFLIAEFYLVDRGLRHRLLGSRNGGGGGFVFCVKSLHSTCYGWLARLRLEVELDENV